MSPSCSGVIRMIERLHKYNLPLAIAAILVIVVLLGLIYRQYGLLVEAREDLQLLKQQLENTRDELESRVVLSQRSDELRENMDLMRQYLPNEPRENEVLRKLDAIAGGVEVDLSSIRFQQRVDEDDYIQMPIHLRIDARYGRLMDFVRQMDTAQRTFRLDEVRMSADDDQMLTVDLRCSVFYTETDDEGSE